MSPTLYLTPSGQLHIEPSPAKGSAPEISDRDWLDQVVTAFYDSQAHGLFAIAADKPKGTLPPFVTYWRDFASLYLTEL
jgi:hypothetical protein